MWVRGSIAVLGLVFLAAQTFLLPPDGWVTGDQGSKYLQTRAFAEHGPLNPHIDVLARDLDPEYRYQEPKLEHRRGRLVSEFLWLLPLGSAPFYRLFGLRGLYVVPAISVLVIFLAAAALGRRLWGGSGAGVAWMVILVTPMMVYGLEFWEHAPAVACVMVAAALSFPGSIGHSGNVRLLGAGAALAAGALFREEVIVALPALAIARAVAVDNGRMNAVVVASVWTAVGAAIVFAAAVPVNLLIYGSPLPTHLTQDAWEIATSTPYLQVRREVIVGLLLPATGAAIFLAAIATGITAAAAQIWRQHTTLAARTGRTSGALLVAVHASVLVLLTVGAALPIWNMVNGIRGNDAYRVTSAAHTWTFAAALLYWPWFIGLVNRSAARYMLTAGALILAATFVLVPTDGGSQWSPRFFLAAAPLLAIAAAGGLRLLTTAAARPGGVALRVAVAAIFLASLAMQITGIAWVQRSKARNARFTAWVAERTEPGDVLISNVFWVPELTATLATTRRLLFSWSHEDVPAMAALAASRGFRRFLVVTSPELTGYQPPPVLDLPGVPCRYARGQPVMWGPLQISEYACSTR